MDPALLPVFFALIAVALIGLAINFQRLGIKAADGRAAAAISIYSFTVIFWLLSPFFVEWHWAFSRSCRPESTRGKKFALWLLVLPLGASLARGIVQPTAKFAYAEVPSPVFGTLVMATVSSVAVTIYLLSRDRATIRLVRGQGLNRLIAGGVANGVGLLFLQAAIAYGEVVVAASLSTTVQLWTLVPGQLFLRNAEIGP